MLLSQMAGEAPSDAWSTTIIGVVASIGEESVYSEEQRCELADALTLHLRTLSPLLSAKAKSAVMDLAGTLAARQSDPALRNALKRLLTAVAES